MNHQTTESEKLQSELLLIKTLAASFFSGEDKSAKQAGRIIMEIESMATAALLADAAKPIDMVLREALFRGMEIIADDGVQDLRYCKGVAKAALALAQPTNTTERTDGKAGGEVVAWMREGWGPDCGPYVEYRETAPDFEPEKWKPLYTHPQQQAERVPLPALRVKELCEQLTIEPYHVRAIEAAHGIKDTK